MYTLVFLLPPLAADSIHDLTQLIFITACSSAPLVTHIPPPSSASCLQPPAHISQAVLFPSSPHSCRPLAVHQMSSDCSSCPPHLSLTCTLHPDQPFATYSSFSFVGFAGSSAYHAFLFYSLKPDTCLLLLATAPGRAAERKPDNISSIKHVT